jgi:hypothetical protein
MTSRKTTCCIKGIPITLLKPRWHSLLLILKQFVTCKGRYRLVFLYHIRFLINFIGFDLDIQFYLLMILYNMSKHHKQQVVNSSMFHHGSVKILLMHHLSTIGDSWEIFLMRNGFAEDDPTTNPLLIPNPNSDEPVVKSQFVNSIDELEFIDKTPLDKGLLHRSPKQMTAKLKGNDPHVPVNDASVDSDVKKCCKGRKQQCTDLGFKNKKVGHLISRKLRNQNDTHLSSIDLIEIDEGLDTKIEDFIVWEDPDIQGSMREVIIHTEPHDFVTNLPPCRKGKEEFLGIRKDLKKTTGKIEAPLVDCVLRRPTIFLVHCDGFFECVENYYIDIPLL